MEKIDHEGSPSEQIMSFPAEEEEEVAENQLAAEEEGEEEEEEELAEEEEEETVGEESESEEVVGEESESESEEEEEEEEEEVVGEELAATSVSEETERLIPISKNGVPDNSVEGMITDLDQPRRQEGLGLAETAKIYWTDGKLSKLPENPNCPALKILWLQNNPYLIEIPRLFFKRMPCVTMLDLSRTSIKSLPPSISRLVSLKKFFLRGCKLLRKLPAKIGKLEKLEDFDLEGTEFMQLPKEMGELRKLRCFKFSFCGYAIKKNMLIGTTIPTEVLPTFSQLEELSIDVKTEGESWDSKVDNEWWCADMKKILEKVSNSNRLRALKLNLPSAELLQRLGRAPWDFNQFSFTVGRHQQRIIYRLPPEVEQQFGKWEGSRKCLKYINGEGMPPPEIKEALKHTTVFFLDRHRTIKKLSKFGHENLNKFEYCLLAECNQLQTIIGEDYDNRPNIDQKPALESLRELSIHYMTSLESICRGPVDDGSLSHLTTLTLNTCPKLTTIFTPGMLRNMAKLEVLIVRDCPEIKSLLTQECSTSESGPFLPYLRKVSLLDLPELVNISGSLCIGRRISSLIVYNCSKLRTLYPTYKKIKGEKEWWNSLKWTFPEWSTTNLGATEDFMIVPAYEELRTDDEDFMDQLAKDIWGNSQERNSIDFDLDIGGGARQSPRSAVEKRNSIDFDLDIGGGARQSPRSAVVACGIDRVCLPIAGGAPFLTCCNCFGLLKLPRTFVVIRKNQQKVRCGTCSAIIMIKFERKGLIISVPTVRKQASAEGGYGSQKLLPAYKELRMDDEDFMDQSAKEIYSDWLMCFSIASDENGNKRTKYREDEVAETKKIKGTVLLMKKNLLDYNDLVASLADRFDEILGHKVSLQLISAVNGDPEKEFRGKLGKPAYLEDWVTTITLTAADVQFNVNFEWEEEIGVPGAFIVKNFHHNEFYLKTVTLEDVPGHGRIHFVCNSWVHPAECYKKDRVFFTNQTCLPSDTPAPLRPYREEELLTLRGNGTGKLEEWDRVYDYEVYNDLSEPDKGPKHARPILGGSSEYPYPRRGRTGRPPVETDPRYESRIPLLKSLSIYVPRDERFRHLKFSNVGVYGLKSAFQFLVPEFEAQFDSTPNEFDKFEDVLKLYERGIKPLSLPESIRKKIPIEILKELLRTVGERLFHFPVPQVIKEDKSAWRTDEEFAREMLAGLNPIVICRLQAFPPNSKLNPKEYNNEASSKTKESIEINLEGLTIDEALKRNKLFTLDYHDFLMPYLSRINETSTKTYATRTLLFLKNDGTLKPLAIELSLPHPEEDHAELSEVYTPAEHGAEGTIWQLAKAYVAINDTGYHQLICHWLHTHAAIEPFIIATNRQLSVLHPINKLLHPHFRDTMNINALARQTLLNAGGLLEKTNFPSKYVMEMTAVAYKDWAFPEQALPADLIKRGVAVKDSKSPHGVRLLIEDYPYAVDGLEIWSAIKTWVEDYCSFYYNSDYMVQVDAELQSWWKELREEGHGDKKNEPWWPQMQTRKELVETCTIIIWVASALHAALNFGQYPYGGYLPNRPAMSRRFIPKPGSPEYDELESNPEKAFLKTITPQLQSILGISLIEILSRHTADEVFLGQRDTTEWTTDKEALEIFGRFGKRLAEIEDRIIKMNSDEHLKNRVGPAKMPYTLLIPTSDVGLTGRGIPNSVSM